MKIITVTEVPEKVRPTFDGMHAMYKFVSDKLNQYRHDANSPDASLEDRYKCEIIAEALEILTDEMMDEIIAEAGSLTLEIHVEASGSDPNGGDDV